MENITVNLLSFILLFLVVSGVPIVDQKHFTTPQGESLDVIIDTLGARVDVMEKTLLNLEAMVLAHGDAIEEQSLQIKEIYSATSEKPIHSEPFVTTKPSEDPSNNLSTNENAGEKINGNETNTGLINKNDLEPSVDRKTENVNKEEIEQEDELHTDPNDELEKEIKPEMEPELEKELFPGNEQNPPVEKEQDPLSEEDEQVPETEIEQEMGPEEQEFGLETEQELDPEAEQELGPETEEEFALESEQEFGPDANQEMGPEMEQETGIEGNPAFGQDNEQGAGQETPQVPNIEHGGTGTEEQVENPLFEPAEVIDDTYEEHTQDNMDEVFGMLPHLIEEPDTFEDAYEMEPLDTYPRKYFRKQWRKKARKNRRKMWKKRKQQRKKKHHTAWRKWRKTGRKELF